MDHFNVAYINESFEPCSARDYHCVSVIYLKPGPIGALHSTSKIEKKNVIKKPFHLIADLHYMMFSDLISHHRLQAIWVL